MSETFVYTSYAIYGSKQSVIDKDVFHKELLGTICPSCKVGLAPMEHGDTMQCPSCKLHMRLHGNGLECSFAPMEEK